MFIAHLQGLLAHLRIRTRYTEQSIATRLLSSSPPPLNLGWGLNKLSEKGI